VQQALDLTAGRAGCSVLDLGTGSGAIALAIASERPGFRIIATDVSAEAVALARYNSARLGYTNVDFACGEWFDPVAGRRFDLIVSNPPYVADDDPHLAQAGIGYEPRAALAAGTDGLDCLRHIVRGAGMHLAEGGWMAFEHGAEQGDAARHLLAAAGFTAISTQRDLENRERVTVGCFGEDLA
jgi:release factor glutamine methyltransferase